MRRMLMLDVDGVLVTGRPEDGARWDTGIRDDLGIAPDRLAAMFFARHWDAIACGRRGLREVLDPCLPAIAEQVSTDTLIDDWFSKDSRLDQAVLRDIDTLRASGHRVLLATSREHLRARYLMEDLALAQHVDGIIHSAALAAMKPEPEFFRACCERVATRPDELQFVDDVAVNVTAARQAGWRAYHWTAGQSLLEICAARADPACLHAASTPPPRRLHAAAPPCPGKPHPQHS